MSLTQNKAALFGNSKSSSTTKITTNDNNKISSSSSSSSSASTTTSMTAAATAAAARSSSSSITGDRVVVGKSSRSLVSPAMREKKITEAEESKAKATACMKTSMFQWKPDYVW